MAQPLKRKELVDIRAITAWMNSRCLSLASSSPDGASGAFVSELAFILGSSKRNDAEEDPCCRSTCGRRREDEGVIVPTLLITGTVGVGKSTVAAEINDVLAERQIPNAALDLDALIRQYPSTSPWNTDLMFANLAVLWPNYQTHGATHLVLARVLENRDELDRYRTAVPGAEITVCRLVAEHQTLWASGANAGRTIAGLAHCSYR